MNSKDMTSNIIKALGFESLNDMQTSMLECKNNNIILLSPTGSGKSVAFLLPLVLSGEKAIIIAPTRELSQQIESVIRSMKTGISVASCYGGHRIMIEERSITSNEPTIIVGTAGRILDHLRRGNISHHLIKRVILDEYDKLLELGFEDEMSQIMRYLKNVDHHTLTSATKCKEVSAWLNMENITTLNFLEQSTPTINYYKAVVNSDGRKESLLELLCNLEDKRTIVFCTFREASDEVCDYLYDEGIECESFHGGMEQFWRDNSLTKFRGGAVNVLVATDLASRGIDVSDIEHIIHYQLPKNKEAYIHRNGRTARMNKTGKVIVMQHENDEMPDYIETTGTINILKSQPIPLEPYWQALHINKGKKNKVNRGDVLGVLCCIGKLDADEIGLIEVRDYHSYVFIPREKAKETAFLLRGIKIKKQSTLITIAK